MPRAEICKRLRRKLRRDTSSILTDPEIRLVAAEVRRLLGPGLAEVLQGSDFRVQDGIRWLSLKVRCEQARAERGLSLKEAALALKVPRYRLAAIEAGTLGELKPDVARRYFRFLGIESWVRRWSRVNRDLARRAGIVRASQRRGDSRGSSQRTI